MKTILVVGREWKFRALLRAQLREEGYQALGFATLKDAEEELAGAAALVFDTAEAPSGDWPTELAQVSASLPVLVVASATEVVEIPSARVLRRPLRIADVVAAVKDAAASLQ